MSVTQIDTDSDATWAKMWSVDDDTDKTALLATIGDPKGLARGDTVYQVDTDTTYIFVGETNLVPVDGEWVPIPYSAGDFTGAGTLVWTVDSGDLLTFSYKFLDNHTVVLSIQINLSSVSGTGNTLNVAVPAVITPLTATNAIALVIDNGTIVPGGFVSSAAGVPEFVFLRNDFGNFSPATNTTGVFAILIYEV